jgi:hypothetical protein
MGKSEKDLHYLFNDIGERRCSDFLLRLTKEIAHQFVEYSKNLPDQRFSPAFAHTENQLKGYVTSAISRFERCCFMEQVPVARTKNLKTKSGLADYWVQYKDESYLIELKQGWTEFDGQRHIFKNSRRHLNDAYKALHCVSKTKELLFGDNLFRVGLVVCPMSVIVNSKEKELMANPIEGLDTPWADRVREYFDAEAAITWVLPNWMRGPFKTQENEKNVYRIYHNVTFIFRVNNRRQNLKAG